MFKERKNKLSVNKHTDLYLQDRMTQEQLKRRMSNMTEQSKDG